MWPDNVALPHIMMYVLPVPASFLDSNEHRARLAYRVLYRGIMPIVVVGLLTTHPLQLESAVGAATIG